MIQSGLGWGVLPESMIDESLHRLSIRGVKMERHLGVLLHGTRTLSGPANALIELLKNPEQPDR
jgi:DNA-binding transcriptional LysR family regulator